LKITESDWKSWAARSESSIRSRKGMLASWRASLCGFLFPGLRAASGVKGRLPQVLRSNPKVDVAANADDSLPGRAKL